jgi:hypothetical protein
MIVETAQLLSTAHHVLDPNGFTANRVYKAAYVNHPMAVWTRQNDSNYRWAYELFRWLLSEYKTRYLKEHSSGKLIDLLLTPPSGIALAPLSDIPQCMPEQYKVPGNPIKAYQQYYIGEKLRFAKWKSPRVVPYFMPNSTKYDYKIDWKKTNTKLYKDFKRNS